MSDIKIQPSATGSATVTLTAPATGTARTVTLPDGTGSLIADNGSGSVGIGTSSPARPLEVKDSSDQANIRLQGSVGYCDLSGNGGNGSDFVVLTEGTEKFRVKESGGVRATDGILFGTDTAAANALDDYEEGTWQPSYTTSSGTVTAHPSYSLCRYTKIGRVVQIQGLVSTSAVSSPSGSIKMYGLPFTVNNNTSGETSGNAAIAVSNIIDLASSVNMLTMHPQTGTTYLNLVEFNGTSTNTNIANRWQQDTYFTFSGTYTT